MRFSFLLVLFLMAATAVCQSVKLSTQHIQVLNAAVSRVSPGMVQDTGKSRGTSVYQIDIKLKSSKASSIKIESLIVDEQVLTVELIKGTERGVSGPFTKGDELIVLARSDSFGATMSLSIQKVIKAKKKAVAWIVYSVGSKQYLVPVQQFQTLNEKQNQ